MKNIRKLCAIEEAIALIKPGSRILVGGFGLRGYPDQLIDALAGSGIGNLTIISCDLGSPGIGLGKLLLNGQIQKLIGSHYGKNPDVADLLHQGKIEVQLVPQGTLVEAIRAAGVGIPAFFTPTGAGTELTAGREIRLFNGKPHVLVEAIAADFALIKAHKADRYGNLVYYKTARNFNPLMAMAGSTVIVQADTVVDAGELSPEIVVTPHVFVDVVVKSGEKK